MVASGLGEGAGEGEEGLVGQEGGPLELVLAQPQVHREMEEVYVLQGVHCGRTLHKITLKYYRVAGPILLPSYQK